MFNRSDTVVLAANIVGIDEVRRDKMEILEVYRENCEKCESENTRSYCEYDSNTITIVCKDCGHRKVKK